MYLYLLFPIRKTTLAGLAPRCRAEHGADWNYWHLWKREGQKYPHG